jgi:hypothetical protein
MQLVDVNLSPEKLNALNEALTVIFDIGNDHEIENPLHQVKLKELLMANALGDKLFAGARGGKKNTKTYGADGIDETGCKVEYKTKELKKSEFEKWNSGVFKTQMNMVYNGAYCRDNIEKYTNIKHFLGVFYQSRLLAIVEVPTKFVTDTLIDNLHKREENERKSGKKGTTNCNSVAIPFLNSKPLIGNLL